MMAVFRRGHPHSKYDPAGDLAMAELDNHNDYLREALRLAQELITLADEGEAASRDDGCRILYGVMRDCGYRLRREAERERRVHQANGYWDGLDPLVETRPGELQAGMDP